MREGQDEIEVIAPTEEEWRASARRSLATLGLTYAELKAQAEAENFSSHDAQALWKSIEDTPGL